MTLTPSSLPGLLSDSLIPWEALLPGSFYYPACGQHAWPVETFAVPGRLFVYVDYLPQSGATIDSECKGQVRRWLESLNGFKGVRDLSPTDLGWQDWEVATNTWFRHEGGNSKRNGPRRVPPFGLLAGIGESWLLYLATEAVATYEALYIANRHRPDWIALIQPAMGWFDFREAGPDNPWEEVLQKHPGGLPPHFVVNGYCDERSDWNPGRKKMIKRWGHDGLTLWSEDPALAMNELRRLKKGLLKGVFPVGVREPLG